jgi:hypothetical protein
LKEKLRGNQFQLAKEIITATKEKEVVLASCNYLAAVFPAAIPMLADLHSGQWQLF